MVVTRSARRSTRLSLDLWSCFVAGGAFLCALREISERRPFGLYIEHARSERHSTLFPHTNVALRQRANITASGIRLSFWSGSGLIGPPVVPCRLQMRRYRGVCSFGFIWRHKTNGDFGRRPMFGIYLLSMLWRCAKCLQSRIHGGWSPPNVLYRNHRR